MVKGEVFFVELSPRTGSEQSGRRPCVVVSNDTFSSNPRWLSVTVVPLTTAARWQQSSPTTVTFREGDCGLPKACTALAHQVTTIDKRKATGSPVGRLTPAKLREVEQALRNYFSL